MLPTSCLPLLLPTLPPLPLTSHRGPAEKERNRLRAARHQAAQNAGNASSYPNKSSPLEASESTTFPTPVSVLVTDSSEVNIDLVEQTDSEKTSESVPICWNSAVNYVTTKIPLKRG